MGITVAWDNEDKTILTYSYANQWSWTDFYTIIKEGNEMINTVQHPVVSIVDMRETTYVPANAFTHIKRIVELSADQNNTNISVFVGAKKFHEMIIQTAKQLYVEIELKATFYFVDDIEVGRQQAIQIQQKLAKSTSEIGDKE